MNVGFLNDITNFQHILDKSYTNMEKIGSGAYGDVYKVQSIQTGKFKALKKIKQCITNTDGINPYTLREILILKELNNKNVIKLLDVFIEAVDVYLVFDYMQTDLACIISLLRYNDEIKSTFNFMKVFMNDLTLNYKLSEEEAISLIQDSEIRIKAVYNHLVQTLFQQLISGVKYIHKRNVLHRDLKPCNILATFNGESIESYIYCKFKHVIFPSVYKICSTIPRSARNIITNDYVKDDLIFINEKDKHANSNSENDLELKISDFGLSRLASQQENVTLTRNLVTLAYRAPELLLNSSKYNSSIDIWSLGCILSEIILGYPLFQGESEIDQLNRIFRLFGTPKELYSSSKFNFTHYPSMKYFDYMKKHNNHIDEEAIRIAESMMKLDYNERASAHEVFKMADYYLKKDFISS
jgi:serine/threonine protein kinase